MIPLEVTRYVAGFLIDKTTNTVALVIKRKPDWQKGKLNAIGGKMEEGETPLQAMIREFEEETGHHREDWEEYCLLQGSDWEVHFFRAFETSIQYKVETKEEEIICIINIAQLENFEHLPNLNWLIPMALSMDLDKGCMFNVCEVYK